MPKPEPTAETCNLCGALWFAIIRPADEGEGTFSGHWACGHCDVPCVVFRCADCIKGVFAYVPTMPPSTGEST